jgi:hypothetical protein
MARLAWQWRYRGQWHWRRLERKPDVWCLELEYRSLDAKGNETWRSPHVNGYEERPPVKEEWVDD